MSVRLHEATSMRGIFMALPFQLDSSAVIKLSAVPFTRNSSIDFPYAIRETSLSQLPHGYADVVEAIHVMQESMDIAGTTAKEAEATISGSVNALKSAVSNLIVQGNCSAAFAVSLTTIIIIRPPISSPLPHTDV